MQDHVRFPKYVFGLHEPGGEWLMEEKGKKGWIVFTHGLGRDPLDLTGYDYRPWSEHGFGVIARLNHGYGSAGTIPLPQHYAAFAQRVRSFVANSPGCHIWVIGNEMNHGQERPDGQIITPGRYAACYKNCWDQIHGLPGHEHDQVVAGAVAPWNNTTAYPGNEGGDWIKYFFHILRSIRDLDCPVDAISLHTYTHGSDPRLVFSEQGMDAPFHNRHYNFRCYQDFMNAIPQELRHVPVYITETDQNQAWDNVNRGWVQNAYREISSWNADSSNQQIRALILYRWPRYDQWYIQGKSGVYADFREAMNHEYVWREIKPPRQINGFTVRGAFLEFFDEWGQDRCGAPITEEIVEDGLKTQYFERLVLQQDQSGDVHLKAVGVEVQALRRTTRDLRAQTEELQERIRALEKQIEEGCEQEVPEGPGGGEPQEPEEGEPGGPGDGEGQQPDGDEPGEPGAPGDGEQQQPEEGAAPPAPPVAEIVRPMWENIVYELPSHAEKRYDLREARSIRYLVISHTAVSSTVTAEKIAQFHVEHLQWPGIGYHFYIDGKGHIFQTNELTTISYHVGDRDPIALSICIGGNFTDEIPNPAQLASAAHLSAWLLQELALPVEAVKGKQEFVDTQSPGYQWLAGKRWKDLLYAEIRKAQSTQVREHPPKPLYHYLLLRDSPAKKAGEDWQAAKAYIDRFQVIYGISVEQAKRAKMVTIVGGVSGVGEEVERDLLDAGCRVERISGKDSAENDAILRGMAQRGQRFPSLVG
jgi:hypothetical protein